MRAAFPYLLAVLMLISAIFLGSATERFGSSPGNPLQPAVDGFDEIRLILAEVLYLKLDDYHHIMMYQGYEWTEISDYLPQIWLIIRLKPDFARAYEDGAYHLAVNLGSPDRGLELLEEGLSHCPGNLSLLWQNVVIRWRTGFGSPRDRLEACLQYARVLRMNGNPDPRPTEMRNNYLIGSWVMEEGTGEYDSLIAARYGRRAEVLTLTIRSNSHPSS